MNINRYPCPCCGFLTLGEERRGSYDICPVCYWEDDGVQFENPDFMGGANKKSLNQARENFLKFGASSQDFLQYVRQPKPEEIPPS